MLDFHALRHSAISRWARSGIHPKNGSDSCKAFFHHADNGQVFAYHDRGTGRVLCQAAEDRTCNNSGGKKTGVTDDIAESLPNDAENLTANLTVGGAKAGYGMIQRDTVDAESAIERKSPSEALYASGRADSRGEADGTRTRNPQIDSLVL